MKTMHILQQALVGVLSDELGRQDIKMYSQNGLAAGQTVPHAHVSKLMILFFL